jgi:hypothetical protein
LVFEARQADGSPELGTPLVCGQGVVVLAMVSLLGVPGQSVPAAVVTALVVTDVLAVRAPPAERPGEAKVTAPVTVQLMVVGGGAAAPATLGPAMLTAAAVPTDMAKAAITNKSLLIMVLPPTTRISLGLSELGERSAAALLMRCPP